MAHHHVKSQTNGVNYGTIINQDIKKLLKEYTREGLVLRSQDSNHYKANPEKEEEINLILAKGLDNL